MWWHKGRGDSGYFKFKLWSFHRFDCYILKYPKGSEIHSHIDPVTNSEHHRWNYSFGSYIGGRFYLMAPLGRHYIDKNPYKFRPDEEYHGVSKVLWGTRYVLSIGWTKG